MFAMPLSWESGLRVVAVVEKLHASDFLDLQARLREWSSDQAGGAFFQRKVPKHTTGGDGHSASAPYANQAQTVGPGSDARLRES